MTSYLTIRDSFKRQWQNPISQIWPN